MKQLLLKMKSYNPDLMKVKDHKWMLNAVMITGGVLLGVGVADCIMAIEQLDLDQIARGLTIFSAGLTIVVLVDNTKTQKATNRVQLETQLQLKNIEKQLEAISHSQQFTEKQLEELQELKSCLAIKQSS